jgi:hypothetical protein
MISDAKRQMNDIGRSTRVLKSGCILESTPMLSDKGDDSVKGTLTASIAVDNWV